MRWGLFENVFKRLKDSLEIPVLPYEPNWNNWVSFPVAWIELEKEEIREAEPEVDEGIPTEISQIKKPLLVRLFSAIFRSREKEEILEEQLEEETVEDTKEEKTKELLKAIHKWLKKLPQEDIKEFKESKDYELYKEVLKMYGLIKSE